MGHDASYALKMLLVAPETKPIPQDTNAKRVTQKGVCITLR
jgi:hypothetical protein